MTTRDVLVAAKGHLLTHGWQQDFSEDPAAPTCVNGAVYRVTEDNELRDRAYWALSDAIGVADPSENPDWNDHPDRTFVDVVDVYDRAIAAAAPKEVQPLHEALA